VLRAAATAVTVASAACTALAYSARS
jgi:hypothetical protein